MEKKELSQEQIDAISAGTGVGPDEIFRVLRVIDGPIIYRYELVRAGKAVGVDLSSAQADYIIDILAKK